MRRELWLRRAVPPSGRTLRRMYRMNRMKVVGAVLATVLPVGAISACAGGGSAQTLDGAPAGAAGTPSPVPSSPIPSTGPQGAAGEQVLRVYREFWAAEVRASASAAAAGSGLQTYATDQALSDSLAGIVRLQRAGLLMSGQPRLSPRVTAVDLQSNPRTATVWDCVDVADWHQMTAKGRRTADPAGRLTRYVTSFQARTVGGQWMISGVTRRTDLPC